MLSEIITIGDDQKANLLFTKNAEDRTGKYFVLW